MKKKLSIVIALILGLCMCLSGCAGIAGKHAVPDPSFAVIGNGGMSVQQGKYIYFINGYADIVDESGKTNVSGNVTKGGIYRLTLANADGSEPKTVTSTPDAAAAQNDANLFWDEFRGFYGTYRTVAQKEAVSVQKDEKTDYSGFEMTVKKDTVTKENGVLTEKEYAAIDATQIVSKKVSNGGTENGGIYIYEGWIYYCSPVTKRNKEGKVQYKLTAFMRTRLDGSRTETIYETSNPEKTPTYGYYRYGGKTYLIVLDDGVLRSITCKDGGGKGAVYTLAKDVVDAKFSLKPVYYSGMPEDTADDYVYFTRKAVETDITPVGQVLSRMRPDGTEGRVLSNDSTAVVMRNLQNGVLYYSKEPTNGAEKILYANNFASLDGEQDAKTDGNTKSDEEKITGLASLSNIYISNTIGAYDPLTRRATVGHYVIAGNNGGTVLISGTAEPRTIVQGEAATVIGIIGDTMYYYIETRTDIAKNPVLETVISSVNITNPNALPTIVTKWKAVIGQFMPPDISAGYLFSASTSSTVRQALDLNTNAARQVSGYAHVRRVVGYFDEPEWTIEAFSAEDLKEVEKTKPEEPEAPES